MKTLCKAPGKVAIAVLALTALFILPGQAQQHVIVNKDNTRPETREQLNFTAFGSVPASPFTVSKHNGYNELSWAALNNDQNNRVIVEYSFNGIDFQSSGPVVSANGSYSYKHYTLDTRPVLYRLRTEDALGKVYYSNSTLLEGKEIAPVQLYATVVKGNMINATAQFPVERIIISATDGTPVFTKDVNGLRDHIPLAIPELGRGMYVISFYGNGWQSSSKFVIG